MGPSGSDLARAVVAFLALPGVVAIAVPVTIGFYAHYTPGYIPLAIALLASGTFLLLWCVREFHVCGHGTLAPWAPPQRLVTTGPYRFSRNPMYIGVTTILLGWSALWASPMLLAYAVLVLCASHFRVRLSEEPWARHRFGAEWQEYAARVPRWLMRFTQSS
jgi:protein-S-isoprenylcysteine O-methyltransferase Ste14